MFALHRSQIAIAETAIPPNPASRISHHSCLKCEMANSQQSRYGPRFSWVLSSKSIAPMARTKLRFRMSIAPPSSSSEWNRFDEGDTSRRISASPLHQGDSRQPNAFILAATTSIVAARRMRVDPYRCAMQHSLRCQLNQKARKG